MKELKLIGSTSVALVDDEDYEYLSQWRWYEHMKGYVYGRVDRKQVFLHRLVNETPKGLMTDHISRNKLDNRRSNLRSCTPKQNQQNRDLKAGKSGYRGVTVEPNGKFRAMITVNGKKKSLGNYNTAIEAARVWNDYAYIYHGEFAVLNK